MALFVNEGDVFTVRIGYSDPSGNRSFNVLQYEVESISVIGGGLVVSEPVHDVAPKMADEFYHYFWTNWKVTASEHVRMLDLMVQSIWPVPKSRAFQYNATGVEGKGDILNDAMPLQDAPTLLKRGPGAHRSNLGRIFLPGTPENGAFNGKLTPGQKNLLDLLTTTFSNLFPFDSPGGQTYTMRPVLAHVLPDTTLSSVPIMEVQVSDDILKTQRRRRPGKGI